MKASLLLILASAGTMSFGLASVIDVYYSWFSGVAQAFLLIAPVGLMVGSVIGLLSMRRS